MCESMWWFEPKNHAATKEKQKRKVAINVKYSPILLNTKRHMVEYVLIFNQYLNWMPYDYN
jgi:hypothetical protein